MSRTFDTERYWERRYASGGNSGKGSYGCLNDYKTSRVAAIVRELGINCILDIGCGSGSFSAHLQLPEGVQYIGTDLSPTALSIAAWKCRDKARYRFVSVAEARVIECDLHISLDVIFHQVEDTYYGEHLAHLFSASRYVLAYTSNSTAKGESAHIRHRRFTDDVPASWKLVRCEPNPHHRRLGSPDTSHTSFCDFFLFARAAP